MLPRAAPRPRAGACTLASSLRCLRTSDRLVLRGVMKIRKNRLLASPRRCWSGAARAGICLPRGAHAAPGCPEASSRRLHPGVLPPLPAHLGSSCSPGGCCKFEKIDLPPTMLDRRFKSRHLLTQRRACCPGLPRGPEQAPAPWSPPKIDFSSPGGGRFLHMYLFGLQTSAFKHPSTSRTITDVSVRSAEKCSVERSKEAQLCSSGSVHELNVRAHNP